MEEPMHTELEFDDPRDRSKSRQLIGEFDVLGCEIDALGAAFALRCQVTRNAAKPAADIQHQRVLRSRISLITSAVAARPPMWNSSTGAKSTGRNATRSTPVLFIPSRILSLSPPIA